MSSFGLTKVSNCALHALGLGKNLKRDRVARLVDGSNADTGHRRNIVAALEITAFSPFGFKLLIIGNCRLAVVGVAPCV